MRIAQVGLHLPALFGCQLLFLLGRRGNHVQVDRMLVGRSTSYDQFGRDENDAEHQISDDHHTESHLVFVGPCAQVDRLRIERQNDPAPPRIAGRGGLLLSGESCLSGGWTGIWIHRFVTKEKQNYDFFEKK